MAFPLLDEGLIEEIKRLATRKLIMEFDIATLLNLVACAQLGLRHPANTGEAASRTKRTIETIIKSLAGFPLTQEVIRMGFDERYDG